MKQTNSKASFYSDCRVNCLMNHLRVRGFLPQWLLSKQRPGHRGKCKTLSIYYFNNGHSRLPW